MQINADWVQAKNTVTLMQAVSTPQSPAYFVGGCVRNALMGAPISDIDIATASHPDQILKLAEQAGLRAIPTGIEHGTITVLIGDEPFEITTFRKDIATDGRRAVVAFSDNIEQDAKRRDFTMNAIYADADGNVIDPLGGLPDLMARRVRFIEDADQRIAEDYLRILRFFRFHTFYGDADQGMDADALAACAAGVDGLQSLSKERITSELSKILAAPNPAPVIATMQQVGVMGRILPASDARFLPILIDQERDIKPEWIRRLAVLGGDPNTNLRLSKAQSLHLKHIHKIITDGISPVKAGYYFGVELARSAHLVLAALTEQNVATDLHHQFNIGAQAQGKFPVKASDLPSSLVGADIGQRLKTLERAWIDSGFTLSKSQLLN